MDKDTINRRELFKIIQNNLFTPQVFYIFVVLYLNMNMGMRSIYRKTGIFFISSLILFSTIGVAIYHHICGCPSPVTQPVQIADDSHSCCHVPETQVCCTEGDHSICDTEDSHKCRNEVTYLKTPIISTLPIQKLSVSVASFDIPVQRIPETGMSDESVTDQPYIRPEVLPPRAGGPLFIILHQLKIPFPEDHC